MKNIFKFLLFSFVIAGLWSCKKDENKVMYLGGTSPVLTTSNSGDVPLEITSKNAEAILLTWTNPNYKFNTGISSQDVNYTLQLDVAGANFSSPDVQEKSLSKDLAYSLTVGELNTMLAKLGLEVGTSYDLEMRLKAYLAGGSAELVSNTLSFSAIPYLDVAVPVPASGEIYITGDATASNWTNSPPADQKFTQVSNTLYEIIVPLIGGKSYTFLPVYGSWDSKYSIKDKNDPALVNGGPFQVGGEDILAPAVSGNYKITLDFVIGKFTVKKV